jgi:hypothetical protein
MGSGDGTIPASFAFCFAAHAIPKSREDNRPDGSPRKPVDIPKLPQSAVDISSRAWHTSWAVDVPFCWTGGLRSLTTDTMCQNLFETIGVFERQWSE